MNTLAKSSHARIPALLLASLIASAGLLGGCFELEDAPNMSAAEYDDVATAMGAFLVDEGRGQSRALHDAVLVANGIVPGGFELAGEVAYADVLGVEYSLAAVCSDELGRGVLCGDDAVTAHVEVAWYGEWSTNALTASVDVDANWIVEGLDRSVLTLDGQARGTANVIVTRDGAEREWDISYRASYSDVLVATKAARPSAGRASYELTVARTSELPRSFVVSCNLSFEADGSALLTLDGDQTYRAHADGSVVRVAY
jgi:hypothetical protein